MAITNGYATLAEVKDYINEKTNNHDSRLEKAIEAASRAIDEITGRTFFTSNSAKRLTAQFSDCIYMPEAVAITSVKTDTNRDRTYATTLTTSNYETNGESPITTLMIRPDSSVYFLTGNLDVEITADWGYSSTAPHNIREACILAAARLFYRRNAVLGVVAGGSIGGSDVAAHLRADVDFMALITHMIKFQLH